MLDDRKLLTLKYLWEESTEEHYVSCVDIMRYLAEQGLKAPSRATIYKDINQLQEFGIDIEQKKGTQNHYWIRDRVFSLAELQLLTDAVQAAQFISKSNSATIIDKLNMFAEPGNDQLLNRMLLVESRPKSTNERVFVIVNELQYAIANKKKVHFYYVDYSPAKKKVYRHNGQLYSVSPFSILWNGDNYYMIGWSDTHDKIACFRVDRMDKASAVEERAHAKPKRYRESDYYSQIFSMYDGPECEVVLLCQNEMMNTIIDRFGIGVNAEIMDRNRFKATVTVHLSNNFFGWLCALAGKVKLIAPQTAVDQLHELVQKV